MNALPQVEMQIISDSSQRSEALGHALGGLLQTGDIVCLSGQLGAGKTVLSRGIGAGWGAVTPLTSPTYNLAHEHGRARDDMHLIHIDLYRITGASEAETLGLEDYLADDDIVIIEWPERILDVLPAQRLWIDIEVGAAGQREFIIEAQGERYMTLVDRLRHLIAATL